MVTIKGFPNFHIVNHPLVQHKLTLMRQEDTPSALFRSLMREITFLLAYEATADMKLTTRAITTPMTEFENAPTLEEEKPMVVPILRAGLFMSEPMLEILPSATQGMIGMYRDEKTKKPVEYFVKLPAYHGQDVFLVDPMFATGGSAVDAVKVLEKRGITQDKIVFMALVGVMDAVKKLAAECPKVRVYIAAIDDHLNENAYIIPGLGDAGDRFFGTEV